MTTFERVASILRSYFEVDPGSITPESRLQDLAIDSLGVIEIMFAVEDEFKVIVPRLEGDARPTLVTVDDLVRFIDRLLSEQTTVAQEQASS